MMLLGGCKVELMGKSGMGRVEDIFFYSHLLMSKLCCTFAADLAR